VPGWLKISTMSAINDSAPQPKLAGRAPTERHSGQAPVITSRDQIETSWPHFEHFAMRACAFLPDNIIE
jgi:hypothetical protein